MPVKYDKLIYIKCFHIDFTGGIGHAEGQKEDADNQKGNFLAQLYIFVECGASFFWYIFEGVI